MEWLDALNRLAMDLYQHPEGGRLELFISPRQEKNASRIVIECGRHYVFMQGRDEPAGLMETV